MKILALALILAAIAVGSTSCSQALPYRGVNLAGAEFGVPPDGSSGLPGKHGVDYVYPDPTYATGYVSAGYFLRRGMNAFRLPFRWERLQPERRRPLDPAELERLSKTVRRLTARGATVILDPHNSARYGVGVVGDRVAVGDFADFWRRLARVFGREPQVLFGLVNEPHDLPTEQWVVAANAAIAAIREGGAANLILVPGNGWSSAASWHSNWYGTPNATAMLGIRDPAHNSAYEVHQYFDANSSGSSAECMSSTIGSERVHEFTRWLREHRKKGFLGEFGGGKGTTCLAALDDLLTYLEHNSDVWLGFTYWAAGPWWADYFMSLEPKRGREAPQMAPLLRHL